MAITQSERKRPRRTFTMEDAVFELLTRSAEDADVSRIRLLEHLVLRAERSATSSRRPCASGGRTPYPNYPPLRRTYATRGPANGCLG